MYSVTFDTFDLVELKSILFTMCVEILGHQDCDDDGCFEVTVAGDFEELELVCELLDLDVDSIIEE